MFAETAFHESLIRMKSLSTSEHASVLGAVIKTACENLTTCGCVFVPGRSSLSYCVICCSCTSVITEDVFGTRNAVCVATTWCREPTGVLTCTEVTCVSDCLLLMSHVKLLGYVFHKVDIVILIKIINLELRVFFLITEDLIWRSLFASLIKHLCFHVLCLLMLGLNKHITKVVNFDSRSL